MFISRNGSKRIIATYLLSLVLLCIGVQAKEHGIRNEHLWLNGELVVLNAEEGFLHLENGTTYVPLRFVSNKLGCTVTWDSSKKEAIIYDGFKQIVCSTNAADASRSAKIIDDKTYVPIRFVSEQMGLEVNYSDGIIYIGTIPIYSQIQAELLELNDQLSKVYNEQCAREDVKDLVVVDLDNDRVAEVVALSVNEEEGTNISVYKYNMLSQSVHNILQLNNLVYPGFSDVSLEILVDSTATAYAIQTKYINISHLWNTHGFSNFVIFDKENVVMLYNDYRSVEEETAELMGVTHRSYSKYFKEDTPIDKVEYKELTKDYIYIFESLDHSTEGLDYQDIETYYFGQTP